MGQELQTFLLNLLPPARSVHLTKVTVELTGVRLQLTTTAPAAACPRCARPSSSVHSRYERHLTDLPWGPVAVRIRLAVWKFVCRHLTCPRRLFTERVPELVAPDARKTHRLIAALQALGVALGGQAGAGLSKRIGLPASRDTRWRLVCRLPLPTVPSLSAIEVDDWAHRKRRRDGTIIVDFTSRRPVALLHDREANTLATWIRELTEITVIARDRMQASIDGARTGAPQAIQVADRFRLLQNLAEALDQVFSAHGNALKAVSDARSRAPVVQPDGRSAVPVPPCAPTPQEHTRAQQRRPRRLATYEQVWRLHDQDWSNRTMAQPLGLGRMTVVRYLHASTFPERKGRSDTGKSVLTPDQAWRLKRWNAGCRGPYRSFGTFNAMGTRGATPRWRAMLSVCARRRGCSRVSGARTRRSPRSSSYSTCR